MYEGVKFGPSPLSDIEEDLQEMSEVYPKNLNKIMLANGDPTALPTHRLIEISDLIHDYFPDVKVLSCQASIHNLKHKSQEELNQLYEACYDDFYIGIESSYEGVLIQRNKGFNSKEQYETLEKLQNAKIRYISLLMAGVGGVEHSKEHVEETANLLNKYPPKMVSIITTGFATGSELEKMVKNDEFHPLTESEIIKEEIELLNI